MASELDQVVTNIYDYEYDLAHRTEPPFVRVLARGGVREEDGVTVNHRTDLNLALPTRAGVLYDGLLRLYGHTLEEFLTGLRTGQITSLPESENREWLLLRRPLILEFVPRPNVGPELKDGTWLLKKPQVPVVAQIRETN